MTIQMIPLNKLIPSPANVRKTGALTDIEGLAASIAALGLLQNLQVRPASGGKFEVVAGRRRLAALKRLAKAKIIAKTEDIACDVRDGEDAVEISLAENFLRLPMHPADQFEAFKAIADQGKGPEEIAARFGCSPITVRQRLKLASVAPSLIEAYRAEEMDLDQLMAFTVSDDRTAQERVWAELPTWNRTPSTIRRQLTAAHIEADDRRAQFVGLAVYTEAGGHILRDLFDEEHEGYLTDPALLDRLVAAKLEKEAEAIRAEGWAWIEIAPDIGYDRLRSLRRVYPEREPPAETQQAEIDRLTAEYDALIGEHGDDAAEDIAVELDRLSDRIDALSEGNVRWLPEDIARAGAIIGIGHGGRLAIERGLLRPEDDRDATHGREPRERSAPSPAPRPGLSDRLIEQLTAHRTAALRFELANRSDLALTAVVHALALPVFFPHETESCLDITLDSTPLQGSDIEISAAGKALAEFHDAWRRRLPAAPDALWDWLLMQDLATRLDLLAYCAGCSINAVRKRHERADNERLCHADRLAASIGLDMTHWWQPTAESYFRHVPKACILEAVRDGVTPEAAENLAKLKKDALAAAAAQRIQGTGWLPAILRAPVMAVAEEAEPALDALAAE
ncbi:MAG: ParB/RepB/Spo0J family partition protein [Rhizobiaceae bacterium]